ncbi:MAG: HEAT repeat domain-containing protein [Planctomycetes bacterium]|nr:HEAT repeat domain-containing protein [Planctomycetota bacterium]
MRTFTRLMLASLAVSLVFSMTSCGDPEIKRLRKNIKSPDANTRVNAASEMGGMKQDAAIVVPMLMDAMGDENEDVRRMAIDSLILLGTNPKEMLPKLKQIVTTDKNGTVRVGAIEAMVKLAAADPETIGTLRGALKDQDLVVAKTAAIRLLSQKEQAAGDVAAIVEVLKKQVQFETEKKAPGESMSIAWGLGELGPKASAALPALTSLAADPNLMPQTKTMLETAIASIKGEGGPAGGMMMNMGNMQGPPIPGMAP